jgi:hypothetical protein
MRRSLVPIGPSPPASNRERGGVRGQAAEVAETAGFVVGLGRGRSERPGPNQKRPRQGRGRRKLRISNGDDFAAGEC